MKKLITLLFSLLVSSNTFAAINLVVVHKNLRILQTWDHGELVKQYKIRLGTNPVGPKIQRGDAKTPEGIYFLDFKSPNSNFYKKFHVTYPNSIDQARARELGVDPGDSIFIHGQPNDISYVTPVLRSLGIEDWGEELIRSALAYIDWTNGCIALSNSDMDEFYSSVPSNTKLIIFP